MIDLVLIIVDGCDGSGKTTLSKMISERLKLPVIHPFHNVFVQTNEQISLWAQSQYVTIKQLHEATKFDCIFDRFYSTEWVYNYFKHRNYDTSYLNDIDDYFSKQDCFYCYLHPNAETVLARMIEKDEKWVPQKMESVECLLKWYGKFFDWTHMIKFSVETDTLSKDECVEKILKMVSK